MSSEKHSKENKLTPREWDTMIAEENRLHEERLFTMAKEYSEGVADENLAHVERLEQLYLIKPRGREDGSVSGR